MTWQIFCRGAGPVTGKPLGERANNNPLFHCQSLDWLSVRGHCLEPKFSHTNNSVPGGVGETVV